MLAVTPEYQAKYDETIETKTLASMADGAENEQDVQQDASIVQSNLPSLDQILINEKELNAMISLETEGRKWGIDKFPVTNLNMLNLFVKRDISHHFIGKDKPSKQSMRRVISPLLTSPLMTLRLFVNGKVKDCLPKKSGNTQRAGM